MRAARSTIVIIAIISAVIACGRREASEKRGATSVPLGRRASPDQIARERFSEQWRNIASFRQAAAPPTAAVPRDTTVQIIADPSFSETLDDLDAVAIDGAPPRVPIKGDASGPSVLKAQVLLDRAGFSVGSIDGRWGKNSEIATFWFQRANGVTPSGDVDDTTFRLLLRDTAPAITRYTLTADDVAGPFRTVPDDVYEQASLDCLCFSSRAEKIAEKFHSSPALLQRLNPGVSLDGVRAGQALYVPAVGRDIEAKDVARAVVSVEGNYLHAFDAAGRLRFHAPTTVGSKYDPSPNETLKVTGIAFNPDFLYQPKLFSEVPDENPEALLAPGANSPVGVVWMALSKPHYGIHGTSEPETIGYASSHGCVRLTNWDAHELAHRIQAGVPVAFTDPRSDDASPERAGGDHTLIR